jgi:tripartite-type tricarboxylate transporter receptor subunit TctC
LIRRTLLSALAAAICCISSSTVYAQAWPVKPVRIIVPYPAGGPIDVMGRALGQRLGEVWGQSVLVENRSGGNEVIAAEHVARSPADGYTLYLASEASYALNQFLFTKLPYDPVKDFAPIMRIATANMALAVGNHHPATNLSDFLESARKNPGRITYGSGGIGGAQHLAGAWLASLATVNMNHVPYKGLAPALQDIMGGQIDSVFGALSVIGPLAAAGKLKVMGVGGNNRARLLPNIPTFAELGFKDFQPNFYMGFAATGGTSAAVIDKIANDTRAIVLSADFRERNMDRFAFETVADGPAEFTAWLVKDRERQARLVKISGAKLD